MDLDRGLDFELNLDLDWKLFHVKEYSFRGVADRSVAILPLLSALSLDQEDTSLESERTAVLSKLPISVVSFLASSDCGLAVLEVMGLLTSKTALATTRGGVVLGGRPLASPSSNGSASGCERP